MDLFPAHLTGLSSRTLDAFRTAGRRITAAESCTGGLIAGVLTEIAGSSDVVGRTFVTYSNRAKQEVLGVPVATLEANGAVSAQTVRSEEHTSELQSLIRTSHAVFCLKKN